MFASPPRPSSKAPGESPKKKQKISLHRLRKATVGPRFVTIGEVLKGPEVHEGTVVKGEMKNVKIRCICTDNRVGRMISDKDKRGLRFIYVADCTAFMSLGMNAAECGLTAYDLAQSDCSESSRLYFSAELSGDLSWVPTKRNPQAPTFFLNRGTVEKKDPLNWDAETQTMFPTSDVCRMMGNSRFAASSLFTTTGFCGKVDIVDVNDYGAIVCSLEDPVGYVGIELSAEIVENADLGREGDNITESKDTSGAKDEPVITGKHGIEAGMFLFIKGELQMELLDNNAYLAVKGADTEIKTVKEEDFDRYVTKLMSMDQTHFIGVLPEFM